MMAAQLWHHCRIAIPDVDDKIANGEFSPILSWLREKVHDQGVMHPSIDALLENAVGEPLKPEYFVSYLEDKFGALSSKMAIASQSGSTPRARNRALISSRAMTTTSRVSNFNTMDSSTPTS